MTTGGSDRNSQTLAQIEQAYSDWGSGLLRFAMRLCGNREDAEDIVVEAFTHAYQKWDTFKGTGSRRSWLYGIAINRHRMNRRKQNQPLDRLTDEMQASESNILDQIALQQAIAKLPLAQREAFLLVKSEGLTSREAADILGKPLGTILYEVHQAMKSIRGALLGKEVDQPMPSRLCEVSHEM